MGLCGFLDQFEGLLNITGFSEFSELRFIHGDCSTTSSESFHFEKLLSNFFLALGSQLFVALVIFLDLTFLEVEILYEAVLTIELLTVTPLVLPFLVPECPLFLSFPPFFASFLTFLLLEHVIKRLVEDVIDELLVKYETSLHLLADLRDVHPQTTLIVSRHESFERRHLFCHELNLGGPPQVDFEFSRLSFCQMGLEFSVEVLDHGPLELSLEPFLHGNLLESQLFSYDNRLACTPNKGVLEQV